ncbi:MAG: SRPBCC family protein [Planctomycetes bacterium]|nr:SRPBCC family protein [Planctomycetota bacterium]
MRATLDLPRPLDEVFAFFADAHNLERLTPSFLRFTVRTPAPIEMRCGTLIDYGLRLRGLPFRWRSEIAVWEPPLRFADRQVRGPYRHWFHEHRFSAIDPGTRCEDTVDYRVPGGALVHRLLVRRDVERIFRYRAEVLRALFDSA